MDKYLKDSATRLAVILKTKSDDTSVVEAMSQQSMLYYHAPQLKDDMKAVYDYIRLLEGIIYDNLSYDIIDKTIEKKSNEAD